MDLQCFEAISPLTMNKMPHNMSTINLTRKYCAIVFDMKEIRSTFDFFPVYWGMVLIFKLHWKEAHRNTKIQQEKLLSLSRVDVKIGRKRALPHA